jgi:hypothetical protein
MIGVNIIIHLLFFIIGYSSVDGMEDLKMYSSLGAFFNETSNIYYNLLISICILLIWIILYLRNNAFKNLYFIKKGMLFKQFCIISFIIFISTSQYYSFKKGLSVKIKSLYSWQGIDKDIKTFNRLNIFLMQNQQDYEINKKKYPEPFPLEMAIGYEHNLSENIDTTKVYLKHEGHFVQFYKYAKEPDVTNNIKTSIDLFKPAYSNHDFEDRIVKDVSVFREFFHPSLYNYSSQKFTYGQNSSDYKKQLESHQKILDEKVDFKIQEELAILLTLANKYEIKHNLKVEEWFQLINHKPNYLLSKLINTSNPVLDDFSNAKYNKNLSSLNFEVSYSKKYYFNYNKTDYFFKNVHESYFPAFNFGLLYFLISLSLVIAIILFVFKTTSLKTILLSIVASLVILVLIVWLMSSKRTLLVSNDYREYIIMMFISFSIILALILSYSLKWKKLITSILFSLALFAIPIFFFFSCLSYSKYLSNIHKELTGESTFYKSDFEVWFDSFGFLAIIILTIVSVKIYAILIKKLKARPA